MMYKKNYVIGVDIGGTNIKLGIVSDAGEIVARGRIKTAEVAADKECLIQAVVESVAGLLAARGLRQDQVQGVGFGVPGLVDFDRGVVLTLTNIFGWKNVPLQKLAEAKLGLPVRVDNDVNGMALAEAKFGAGRGYRNMICMTLGTGVGAGLILEGKLYRGEGFCAGELGHVPLNENGPACNCGGRACFERYVGNATLLAGARDFFKRQDITLEDVYALAARGDSRALDFWYGVGTVVGYGLVGAVNLLNPRLIVIGGGVAKSLRFMKTAIAATIRERAMGVPAQLVKVAAAKLGDDAGVIGAGLLMTNDKIQMTKFK
ncbi:MAG: ROK family protein [Candidatus Omnitrophica bacterium]|nr:ROK family protein [Candidatus Omnitrophota bacterium]